MGPDLKECREMLGDCDLSDAEIETIRDALIAIAANVVRNLMRDTDAKPEQK